MATRSTIAYKDTTGKVYQIYCHWDGYLNGNGETLLHNYTTLQDARDLLARGDLSSLKDDTLGCVYYADRGETDVDACEYESYDDYVANGQFEGYDYIFMDDKWYVTTELTNNEFEPLTESLIELEG